MPPAHPDPVIVAQVIAGMTRMRFTARLRDRLTTVEVAPDGPDPARRWQARWQGQVLGAYPNAATAKAALVARRTGHAGWDQGPGLPDLDDSELWSFTTL